MNLQLDQEQIAEAINLHINQAVVNALKGYDVQRAISATISEDVANGAISEAIQEAVKRIDRGTIVQALATELQRATTSAVVNLLHEGLATTILSLRKVPEYNAAVYQQERAKLLAQWTKKD